MTFIYEHDLHPLKLYTETENELSTLTLSTVIESHSTDRQTDRQIPPKNITTPLGG